MLRFDPISPPKATGIKGLTREKVILYKYNAAAMCTTMDVGNVTKYHYDQLGRLKDIPSWVSSVKYNPVGQLTKVNYVNNVQDTIAYDNRLRPTYIKAYNPGPAGGDYLKLSYYYEDNSNVDSIHDYLVSTNRQGFTYDALNRLTNVESSGGDQSFEYDKVGNRTKKNGTSYSYNTNTNQLYQDHRSYKYYYDNNGNILRHRTGSPEATVDSFAYDWNNRLKYYTWLATGFYVDFAYNASGLRVKKHYYCEEPGEGQGEAGTLFTDASNDLGIKSEGADSVYNKGRDIEKIYIKNEANYFTFIVVNRYLFNESNKMKLFITLDLDTIPNSGRLSLPEDSMTKVSPKCTWEYCIYISDNECGLYKADGTKRSAPFGMAVQKVFGDNGNISIKIARSLLDNAPTIRYTLSTYDPNNTVSDTLWQSGSSATDVFPGTPATFGGEINGYGQISTEGLLTVTEYTIFYVYDGIDPIVEYPASGNPLASYVYAGGLHIGKIAGPDSNWYHCDALGSPRKMTDEFGATVTWSASYYPFGEATTSGTNTHQFTGKEMDTEMGLNYMCQRYYDPQIGRFMSLDPVDQKGASPYAYCANNPLILVDPLGLDPGWRMDRRVGFDIFQGALYRERIPFNHDPSGYDYAMEWWSGGAESMSERAGYFNAKSSQMDPECWSKGWDYQVSHSLPNEQRQEVKDAIFWLSSGIFDTEIITEVGWFDYNPGLFIQENNLQIEFEEWTEEEARLTGKKISPREIYGWVRPDKFGKIFLNELIRTFDMPKRLHAMMGAMAHEATHYLQWPNPSENMPRDLGFWVYGLLIGYPVDAWPLYPLPPSP